MARPKSTEKKDRITISFTEFDEDVYDFLKGQRNASALVRQLVRNFKNNTPMPKNMQEVIEMENKQQNAVVLGDVNPNKANVDNKEETKEENKTNEEILKVNFQNETSIEEMEMQKILKIQEMDLDL
ncbi:hypothetical protein C0L75_03055 [Clostridium perfringens]